MRIALRIREFRGGLNAIQDVCSLLYAIFVSVSMWIMIALLTGRSCSPMAGDPSTSRSCRCRF